jgi:hypothetical protein
MRRGFTMVPNAVLRGEVDLPNGKRLSLAARVLYAAILDFSNAGERPCTATQCTLARYVDVSPRYVRTLMRELERANLIRRRREGRGVPDTIFPEVWPGRKRSSGHPRKSGSAKQDLPSTNNESGGRKKERAVTGVRRDRAREALRAVSRIARRTPFRCSLLRQRMSGRSLARPESG